jgi:hypothetical protein
MESHLLECAWCDQKVGENSPVYGLNAKARSQDLIQGKDGTFMPFHLAQAQKTVYGAVVTDDSEAKQQGWDFVFMACSQRCAQALKDALQKELDIFSRMLN